MGARCRSGWFEIFGQVSGGVFVLEFHSFYDYLLVLVTTISTLFTPDQLSNGITCPLKPLLSLKSFEKAIRSVSKQ